MQSDGESDLVASGSGAHPVVHCPQASSSRFLGCSAGLVSACLGLFSLTQYYSGVV